MRDEMQCSMENQIIAQAVRNRLTDVQLNHAAECPVCGPNVAAVSAMTHFANTLHSKKHTLPAARSVWYRAQFSKRRERVSLLDVVSLWMMSLAGVCGTGLFLWVSFPKISSLIYGSGLAVIPLALVMGLLGGILFLLWLFTLDVFLAER